MISIHATSHIGPDGVLQLHLPTEITDADVEVMVIVNEIPRAQNSVYERSQSKNDWQKFVKETAGAWQGEPLERGEQGEYEERDLLK